MKAQDAKVLLDFPACTAQDSFFGVVLFCSSDMLNTEQFLQNKRTHSFFPDYLKKLPMIRFILKQSNYFY